MARVVWSGPNLSALSMASSSESRLRARWTRLLIVPTAVSQIAAASSCEKPDAPTRSRASRWTDGSVIEMATIGREGCTGMQAFFGAKTYV